MTFKPTWEEIVTVSEPIPYDDLTTKIAKKRGSRPKVEDHRPELYSLICDFWTRNMQNVAIARDGDLRDAMQSSDPLAVARMVGQIGGFNAKYVVDQIHFEEGKKTLRLALGHVGYSNIVGTHQQAVVDPEFRERIMQAGLEDFADPNIYFANGMGVCAVVYGFERGDKPFVVVGKRSDKVAIYPETRHVFGGFMNVDEEKGGVDFVKQTRREIQAEGGVPSERVGGGSFLGIIRQTPSRIPEAIGMVPVYLPPTKLLRAWKDKAPGKYEHSDLEIVKLGELPDYLREHGPTMVPSGAAALTKFLEHYS